MKKLLLKKIEEREKREKKHAEKISRILSLKPTGFMVVKKEKMTK